MARMPSPYELGRPTPRPSGIAQANLDNRLVNVGAQTMEQSGADMASLGAILQEEQRRVDKTRAEDAFTELRQRQLDLTMGDEEGFTKVKGGDAVKQPLLQNWLTKFDQASERIASGLDNEDQRRAFKQRADVARLEYAGNILQHTASEKKVYDNHVFRSTLDVETRMAVNNFHKPEDVAASITRAEAVTREYARQNGLDDVTTRDMMEEARARILDKVNETARNADPVGYWKSIQGAKQESVAPQGEVTKPKNFGADTVKPYSDAQIKKVAELTSKPSPYDELFEAAAKKYGVKAQDLKMIAARESSLRPGATGIQTDYGQAHGIMQVTDGNLKNLGIPQDKWKDPATNIDAGARLWADAVKKAKGDPRLADKFYYAGSEANMGKNTEQYAENSMAVRAALQPVRLASGPGSVTDAPPPEAAPQLTGNPIFDLGTSAQQVAWRKAAEPAVQKHLVNTYQSEFLANRDNMQGLATLEAKLLSDQNIDETGRNAIWGRIQSQMHTLDVRMQREQEQFGRSIEKQLKAINDRTLLGYEPTAEQLAPLVSLTKGTPYEAAVSQTMAIADATRAFRQMNFREQEAYISRMETDARANPNFDVSIISKFKAINNNQKEQVKSDPVTFAIRQGFLAQDDIAAAPLNIGDPAAMGEQLASRFGLARYMSSKYGAPMKPLTEEEVATISNVFRGAKYQEKSQILGVLSTAAGDDVTGYKAMMGQLAKDDPVTAVAGLYAKRGHVDATNKQSKQLVSDLILRGQAVLNPPKDEDGKPKGGVLWPMPPDKDLRTQFTSEVKNAYAGNAAAESAAFQAAKAVYAAKLVDQGKNDGALDGGLWKESIKLVTGGVEKYRGQHVVMPWGMDIGAFKDGVQARVRDLVASKRLDPDQSMDKMDDLPVRAVGDGLYVFVSGDGVLKDRNGQDVVIDFNKPVTGLAVEPTRSRYVSTPAPFTPRDNQGRPLTKEQIKQLVQEEERAAKEAEQKQLELERKAREERKKK